MQCLTHQGLAVWWSICRVCQKFYTMLSFCVSYGKFLFSIAKLASRCSLSKLHVILILRVCKIVFFRVTEPILRYLNSQRSCEASISRHNDQASAFCDVVIFSWNSMVNKLTQPLFDRSKCAVCHTSLLQKSYDLLDIKKFSLGWKSVCSFGKISEPSHCHCHIADICMVATTGVLVLVLPRYAVSQVGKPVFYHW